MHGSAQLGITRLLVAGIWTWEEEQKLSQEVTLAEAQQVQEQTRMFLLAVLTPMHHETVFMFTFTSKMDMRT